MKKNKKGFRRVELQKPEVITTVDTSFMDAATIRTRPWQRAQIILAGCGGGGSHLAQHVGRLMRAIYRSDKGVHLTLVDPDVVEEKNVESGQNFCDAEVGMPKAEALARRYGHAWGLNCSYAQAEFDDSLIMGCDVTVLVGCVDNAAARQRMHDVLESNRGSALQFWWLDCSNGSGPTGHVGRALVGNAHSYDDLRGAFEGYETRGGRPVGGDCLAVPSPALQFRDLLTPRPEEFDDSGLSCAELALRGQQSLEIGARVAVEGAATLRQLLVTRDLKAFAVEVSTSARSQRATYATPEAVSRVINKPVGHLLGGPRRAATAAA